MFFFLIHVKKMLGKMRVMALTQQEEETNALEGAE